MKKGFLGFLTGTLLGGLTAILTSKHSGKEVRDNLKTAWNEGKTGGKVVLDEVKDVAEELRKEIEEFAESPKGKRVKAQVVKSLGTVKEKVQDFIQEAKTEVEKVKKQVEHSQKKPATKKKAASVKTPAKTPAKKQVVKKAASTVKKATTRSTSTAKKTPASSSKKTTRTVKVQSA